MNRAVAVCLALLSFAIFCFFCIRAHAPMIEHDILSRTTQALILKGVPVDGLTVSGRDVYLAGPVGSLIVSRPLQESAAALKGVRVVNVNAYSATGSSQHLPSLPADASPDAKSVSGPLSAQQKVNRVLETNIVEFDTASATLTAEGRKTLDQIEAILQASPDLLCSIKGYTDSSGDPEQNLDLSRRRAAASKAYLMSKGVADDRLIASGFGAQNPLASNDTPDGRRKNRRIDFLLKEKK